MAEWHVSSKLLDDFLMDDLGRHDTELLLRHLFERCPECLRIAQEFAAAGDLRFEEGMLLRPELHGPDEYLAAFGKAVRESSPGDRQVAHERLRARGLWSLLAPHTREGRLAAVQADTRFHTWGLFDRLLHESRQAGFRSPAEAVELAHLALAVLDHLRPENYSLSFLADLRTEGLAALGNAKRLAADFEGAAEAFVLAERAREEGSGDPVEEASLLSLRASLRSDLGYFEEAAEILNHALALYREIDDRQRLGRTRLQQALYIGWIDPERGLSLICEALSVIKVEEAPRLELCARHNMALFLIDAGRPEEALGLLEHSRELYRQFPDAWTQLRLHYVEGRISRALGNLSEAEHTFRRTAEAFAEHEMRMEYALINVDLVETLAQQERFTEARKLCREVRELLAAWGAHPQLLALWQVFGQSFTRRRLQQQGIEASFYRDVAEYIRRHWHRPAQLSRRAG